MTDLTTPGIQPMLPPAEWATHRFGLPEERWARLRERSYWITGAGTGYGQAMATALAAAGATVYLSGRRAEVLHAGVARMAELGVSSARCHTLPMDIRDPDQVASAAQAIAARGEGLTGLINNAGLPQPPSRGWPLMEMPYGHWQDLLASNLTGHWLCGRAALPLMTAGEVVRILFISSEAGWADTPGFGPYNMTKAGLNSLTASLAAEVAARYPGKDVQINGLIPGEARSEMNQGSTISPFAIVPMALALLSSPAGGPNGRFFHRDGRHFAFAYAQAHPQPIL